MGYCICLLAQYTSAWLRGPGLTAHHIPAGLRLCWHQFTPHKQTSKCCTYYDVGIPQLLDLCFKQTLTGLTHKLPSSWSAFIVQLVFLTATCEEQHDVTLPF